MNLSQLLAGSNIIRKQVKTKLLAEETPLVSSFHFNEFFKELETTTNQISKAVLKGSRPIAEKLAQVLDQDREKRLISRDYLFNSLHDYGTNPAMQDLEINESAAQEILGSFFQTLDTLIQAQDDLDSHLGDNDRQVAFNLERLTGLIENFDSMIDAVFERVNNRTAETLGIIVEKAQEFFTSPTAMNSSVKAYRRENAMYEVRQTQHAPHQRF